MNFDVELLGDCDVIVNELCHRLGGDFEQLCYNSSRLSEITDIPPPQPTTLPEEVSADVQTAEVQNTRHFFTGQDGTVAETSEMVTVTDSCPNAQIQNDGVLNTSCTAKEARTSPELEYRSSSPKPSTQENDRCSNAQPSPCQGDSHAHQNTPLEAVEHSPKTQQEREEIMEMLHMQTEEKHINQRNDVHKECWLKQICQNPISNRLGSKNPFFVELLIVLYNIMSE